MICPVCKTNNSNTPEKEQRCVQCGSDLYVHHLLHEMSEAIQMKSEITPTETAAPKKTGLVVWQIIPGILLLVCAIFGMFVGLRCLTFIDHEEANRVATASKRYEIGLEQVQQMSTIIKQELDLILEQRQENKALQARIQELTTVTTTATNTAERIGAAPNSQEDKHLAGSR